MSEKSTGHVATTKAQREILRHSLFGSSRAKKPFRNYFCETVGGEHESDIAKLIELGLMKRGHTINGGRDYYVHVTEAGAAEIDTLLPEECASRRSSTS
jgi:hypothetical protein